MKTVNDGSGGTKYGPRVIALILLAGGLLGLLESALSVYHSFQQHRAAAGVSGTLSTALFAWCIPVGVALWRTTASGFKWAKLLFAMQVPIFTIARFSYEFSTFFSFRFMIGNTTHSIGGDIGSSSNLNWLPQSVGFLFGINIAAALILLYLIQIVTSPQRKRSRSSSQCGSRFFARLSIATAVDDRLKAPLVNPDVDN